MDISQIEAKRTQHTIHLAPARQADVPVMARVYLLAFQTSPNLAAFAPHRVGMSISELLREGPLEERKLRRGLVDKTTYVKASVRTTDSMGNENEKVVGWAKWDEPPGVRRRSLWEWLWGEILYPLHQFIFRPPVASGAPDAIRALFASQYADTFGPGGIAAHKKLWYLHIICVDPAWQGVGVGRALLEWGMKKAKDVDAVVYLESGPLARRFYIANGFRVASERTCEVNGISISIPGMIWQPKSATSVEGAVL